MTIWDTLEKNMEFNNCNFHIVKGFISNFKNNLIKDGYMTTSYKDEKSLIPNYTLDEIKEKYNINKFSVLVADCEGFLETFLDENPNLINDLRLIIFEEDFPEKCNYDKIKDNLIKNNFILKEKINSQDVYIKNYYAL